MSIEAEIQQVAERVNKSCLFDAQRGGASRHRSNHASALGHACLRKLYYDRTAPEAMLPPELRLAYIFKLGRLFEREARIEIEREGYEVLPPVQAYDYPEHNIVGHLDGLLRLPSGPVPLEIKSVERHQWDQAHTIADLMSSRNSWVRGYVAQLNTYCLLANYNRGVFWLKSKHTFEHQPILLELDYGLAEECLKKAETVNLHVECGEPPDRMPFDASVCRWCDYRQTICGPVQPPRPRVTDAEILAFLAEHERLKEFSSKYTKSQARLKEYFPEEAVVMAGPFEVTVTKNKKGTLMRRVRNLLETKEEE